MKLGRLGVWYSTDKLNGGQLADLMAAVESNGYASFWYPESRGYESMSLAAYLLSKSTQITIGSSIANIYARDPMSAVMGHNALNALYGGRFVLGLGVSHVPLVTDARGHAYGKPVATMRAYLDGMDRAFGMMPGTTDRRVVLAALGPHMSQLAAERTKGAFPYNITPAQVALSRAAMGGTGLLVCEQKVVLSEDPVAARRTARAVLKMYLGLPNYTQNWLRLGFTPEDWAGEGSDRLMDAMVYWGTAAQIRAKLRAYSEAGADQVVVQALRIDGGPGPDWTALEALAG